MESSTAHKQHMPDPGASTHTEKRNRRKQAQKHVPWANISTSSRTLSSTSPSCCAHANHVERSGRSSASHFSRRYVFAIRSKNLEKKHKGTLIDDENEKKKRVLPHTLYSPNSHVELPGLVIRMRNQIRYPERQPSGPLAARSVELLEQLVRPCIQLTFITPMSSMSSSRHQRGASKRAHTDLEDNSQVIDLLLVHEPRRGRRLGLRYISSATSHIPTLPLPLSPPQGSKTGEKKQKRRTSTSSASKNRCLRRSVHRAAI